MQKILLTGGTGFVGANLLRALLARGDEVHLIVRAQSDFWRIADVKEKCAMHVVDIADTAALAALFADVRPEVVYHLAVAGTNQGAVPAADQVVRTNVL